MAYQLTAEKNGHLNLSLLRERLAQLNLIEFFPIRVDTDLVAFGISIPIKVVDDREFEAELVSLLTFLIVEHDFRVTDLYSGNAVRADEISGLPEKIAEPGDDCGVPPSN